MESNKINYKNNIRKLFILKRIRWISFGIILLLCSSCSHIHSNNKSKIKADYPDYPQPVIMNNAFNVADQTIKNKIKCLQSLNMVYFPLDKYCVLPAFFDSLNLHADFLCNNPLYSIIIEGHTDERGTPEYNIGLGERRAYSVKKYLQSKGVLPNQMHIVSYGKEKPLIFGHNEEAYSKNRRVVLLY